MSHRAPQSSLASEITDESKRQRVLKRKHAQEEQQAVKKRKLDKFVHLSYVFPCVVYPYVS